MEHIRLSLPESNPLSPPDASPDGFDLAAAPILAVHWFGIEPWCQVGTVAAEIVADLTYRRQVKRLHSKGPRVVAEFLAELGAERLITTIISQKLDRYTATNAHGLAVAGGGDFPCVPIHKVEP